MPKYYLHQTGKIPTAVHPFVKQTSIREDKQQPFLNLRKMIRGWQNIASSTYRKISLAIARLIRNEP
ncbi:hypothetical protein [Fischerella thermalis]|jgi:hypothetical protein|uniref:Transposase n=1 Tax=Fischerella thermalis JSC-11 TaxID=741277 RepID=G6FQ94_9CYAN|nr:hypothetical protein [Fischerella thermalis]PMB02352.1 hypothetical protein CEN49_25835 [Fischerella thermalis CCMEE 5273]EHC17979.1 hypothetical protein FJSC11DRAFT_1041 [Fischerella thermalis JSC-11]MBF2068547.1 hypothetical protein [Fischerella thermalis M48_A2018_028]PLZ06822.1 hypothetical protein CBP18_17890 [Fischerella thermalis WC119]PLZ07410.1 hypothetical protein CBP17_16485 [Fischerella thermalis WC114]